MNGGETAGLCSGLRVILQKRQIGIPVLQALSIVQTTVCLNYLNAQTRIGGGFPWPDTVPARGTILHADRRQTPAVLQAATIAGP